VSIDQSNIRLAFFQFPDCLSGIIGNSDHDDIRAPARDSIRDQSRTHAVSIRDEDADVAGKWLGQLTH
jgi:hypothetical protein